MKGQMAAFRTGRANPEVLSRVYVDYYGSSVPLKQIASISVPEPMTLQLNVFDKNAVKDVEKAIMTSNLGITPSTDGAVVRLRFPELTEDRRKELVKLIRNEAEEARVAIRNIRRDEMEAIKKKQKDKEISDDDFKKQHDEAQKVTDEIIALVDKMAKDKETEVMTL